MIGKFFALAFMAALIGSTWTQEAFWKPFNGPSGPLADGISVGLFDDGEDSYVGRGTFNGQLAPGTLLIEDSISRKAGFYMEYGRREHFITSNVEYYAKNPDCNYKWIASSNGGVVANAISYKSDGFTFYVGRILDNNSWLVGKVPIEDGLMYYGKGTDTASYEVLVCEKIPATTPKPTTSTTTHKPKTSTCEPTTSPTAANNDWKIFTSPSGLKSDGLSAGIDSMGNELYIGRGLFDGIIMPGHLLIEKSGNKTAGLYVEFKKCERYISTNIEYYSINPMCSYKWLPSSNGKTVKNAIIANPNKYYVGRVKVDGFYQLGKVLLGKKLYYGKGSSSNSYEVLTCDKISTSTTTTTSTTTAARTTEKLTPEVCAQSFQLTADDGSSLKSLCLIEKDANYEQANDMCIQNGMHLFAVDSKAVQDAFLKSANEYYSSNGSPRLWINGKKNENGEWMTFLTTSNNLYSPANWFDTAETGDCLSVLKNLQEELMALSGSDCARIAYVYCEF